MADRATIFQTVQIGVEATPGTGVAANKQLQSLSIEPAIKADLKSFRPMGTKFSTIHALGKESVEAKLSGQPTYDELLYVLASALTAPTTTQPDSVNAPTAYQHVFTASSSSADSPKTFTVEQGGSVRAQKFSYALINALKLAFKRDELSLEGSMIGQALQDGIVMTASPTALPIVPVLPTEVSVYLANTQAGLTGATALTRAISAEWGVEDRYSGIYPLNRSFSSFAAHVETEPKMQLKLKLAADADGMGLLSNMRAGTTKFARIETLGNTIAGTVKYKLVIDLALQVAEVSDFSDEDGLYAIEWTFDCVHDGTWGKSHSVTLVNTQSGV